MNTMPTAPMSHGRQRSEGASAWPARAQFGKGTADPVAMKWAALQDAAAAVAALAMLPPEPSRSGIKDFLGAIREASAWKQELAQQGIDDISAVMETGIAALIAAHSHGSDAVPAARALWEEYLEARQSLLSLVD